MSRPLTDWLKKGTIFIRTNLHQQAFESIKQALTTAPALALPDFNKPFTIETDASVCGIGAVLTQQRHPIAYLSKELGKKSQALSTYENECLIVLMAIDKWKPYLQHKEFTIATDHKSLLHLGDHKSSMQHEAFVKLLGFQYKVVYKKGLENKAADALSRKTHSESVPAISSCKPRWLEIVIEGCENDPTPKQLLTELALTELMRRASL